MSSNADAGENFADTLPCSFAAAYHHRPTAAAIGQIE
jgi:hypothetical protein